jgi:(2Fe-2S) ferredoxin
MSGCKKVLVCIGRSCRKYDSEKVLAAFKQNPVPFVEIIPVCCLGQCGNGPMVLEESESIWYDRVNPDEVEIVIERHLIGDSPVRKLLYPKFHQNLVGN